ATVRELRRLAEPRHVIIDLAPITDAADLEASYVGLAWDRQHLRSSETPQRASLDREPKAAPESASAEPPSADATALPASTVRRGAARAIPATGPLDLTPTREDLQAIFDVKYHQEGELGPGPRTRLSFGYFNPDDH